MTDLSQLKAALAGRYEVDQTTAKAPPFVVVVNWAGVKALPD